MVHLNSTNASLKLKQFMRSEPTQWIMLINSMLRANLTQSWIFYNSFKVIFKVCKLQPCMAEVSSFYDKFG